MSTSNTEMPSGRSVPARDALAADGVASHARGSQGAPAQAGASSCATCFHRGHCLPALMPHQSAQEVSAMLEDRFRVGKGEHIHDHVEPRGLLFVVQSGTFKSEMQVSPGRVRVLDLHDAGDFMAVEAILCGPPPDLIALENSFVCAIRAERLEAAAARQPAVQHHLWQLMSGLLVHAYQTLFVLGRLQAGERLAWYLLQLAQCRKRRGLDPSVVHLPMTREDIGNHLGIRPETVSRLFTHFYRKKLIERGGAQIRILDAAALRDLTDAETVDSVESHAADPVDRPPTRTTHCVPALRMSLRDARPGCAPLPLDTV